MNNRLQTGLLLLLFSALGLVGYNVYLRETTPPERSYNAFLAALDEGGISKVHVEGHILTAEENSRAAFRTYVPDIGILLPRLLANNVAITGEDSASSPASAFISFFIPVVFLTGLWLVFFRRDGNQLKKHALSSRFIPAKNQRVTFADVAGVIEVIEEVEEVVAFLKNPEKFSRLGGRPPKGILLQGVPGTGKTLLAKAIAGEASVSFYSIGGSDFVEIFAGVGASRVRELFSEAKKNAPCIIFIDEIDAIGGRRSGGQSTGSSDEREQTLNALLVEMDGFSTGENVIVIAATNRSDILDPALLRPGRFDRQITLSLPDVKGRLKILEVHTKKIATAPDLVLSAIARSIPGFSGADVANLVKEAALLAARHNKDAVEMADFEEAKDKIIMGLARKNVAVSEKDRRQTAYHEAGHAIVGLLLEDTDPIHKITIIPRGRAMGLTQHIPLDERYTYSRQYLVNRIAILMGGRAAEQLVFNHFTSGASNDILHATEIATKLITEWGMSTEIGPVAYQYAANGFLGHGSEARPRSEMMAQRIDTAIHRVLEMGAQEALMLLKKHNRFLHNLAEALLVNETLDAEGVDLVYRHYLRESELERQLRAREANGNTHIAPVSSHSPQPTEAAHEI